MAKYNIEFLAKEARDLIIGLPLEKRCSPNAAVGSVLDKFDIRPRKFYQPKVEACLQQMLQSETKSVQTVSAPPFSP